MRREAERARERAAKRSREETEEAGPSQRTPGIRSTPLIRNRMDGRRIVKLDAWALI